MVPEPVFYPEFTLVKQLCPEHFQSVSMTQVELYPFPPVTISILVQDQNALFRKGIGLVHSVYDRTN